MGISRISAKHLDRPRRGEQVRITSVLLALLFILPLLAQAPGSPIEPVSMSTSGKSTDADVAVTGINVTTPSAWISAIPTLAPMNHTIRVSIVNIGGSAADGELLLKVSGSPVDNRTVNINPGAQENHLLYWDASSFEGGSSYTLEAVWEADGVDADSSNDEMTITGLSVASVEDAVSIADTLPADGDTMPRAEWSGTMTIANIGNQPVNATAQLSLTSSSGSISITSSMVTLSPGSLANPPVPQII
ncbi:MAG: hypothetical protein VX502_00865, partial [Candidatus Thermoplasmatota archaeon]|nr:hypothetical protein [Candidatus Thermoplasmatota archaeon]